MLKFEPLYHSPECNAWHRVGAYKLREGERESTLPSTDMRAEQEDRAYMPETSVPTCKR